MPGPYSLSGQGTQAIVSCDRLQVTLTNQSAIGTSGYGFPPNYYRQALITPGNASGWFAPVPVVETPLLIPVARDVDRFGYSCKGGATLSVTEVSVAPLNGNPQLVQIGNQLSVPGDSTLHNLVSYTVPAGRVLVMEMISLGLQSSSRADSWIRFSVAGLPIMQVFSPAQGTFGQTPVETLGVRTHLTPGTSITADAVNYNSTALSAVALINGVLFDASIWTPN